MGGNMMGGGMGGNMMGGGMGGRSFRFAPTSTASGMSITRAGQTTQMHRAPTLGEMRRALRLQRWQY